MSASSNNPTLNLIGSGSNIFSVTGSSGGIFSINDIAASDSNLFSVSTGSTNIFSIDQSKNINISGSIAVTGSLLLNASGIVTNSQTGSFVTNSQTGSFVTNSQTGSFARTGSNSFNGNQTITGSLTLSGSSLLIGNQTLIGTKTITGSVFISGSNNFIGTDAVTGSLRVSGSVVLTGATTITGSLGVSGSVVLTGATTITGSLGSLGVGITPSATAGRIDAANDVVAFSTSDKRFKNNITPIKDALHKINQIGGYEFDWNEENKIHHGYEGHDLGVIAQEIEIIAPELVQNRASGYKAVKYDKLISVLIEAIKELSDKIDKLEKQIKL